MLLKFMLGKRLQRLRKYGLVLKATAVEAINKVSVEDPMKKLLDIFDDAEENVMEP